ncbi:MAG: caspase family protein [Gemmatimonadota bacterium]
MTTPRKEGPTRRALLIGIDKYKKFPENFGQLDGCVADVELMRALLEGRFGFPAENITILRNGTATRKRILSALDRFVKQTEEDDIVVIHYAGHGSLMTDREGDEPSGLDSTIVPVDSAGWSGASEDQRDITDDEIHLRLLALGEKTPYTTLIFDCCHSGTISRDGFGGKTRSIPPDRRPAHELPPSPIPEAVRQRMREGGSRGGGKGRSGWLPLEGRYVLIAACRDDEVANEYQPPEGNGKVVHGALTYFLGQELSNAPAGATYREVFERAASRVNAAYRKQNPQMEGEADREVFGVRDIEPHPFVAVAGKRGSLIALGAGAAQGVTVGSKYDVHAEGTRDPAAGKPIGSLTVTRVGGLNASARVDSGAASRMVAGTRAFETEHVWGEFRYRVQLEGPKNFDTQLEVLAEELAALPLIEVVKTNKRADARVYVLPTRTATRSNSPVPQLRAVRAPSWAVVGPNGRLIAPLKRLDQRADLVQNLETLARFQLALGLQNPDPRSRMRGRFDLELLRRNRSGEWTVATPEPASGQVTYDEGDLFACRIVSRHDKPAYPTLFDFGLTGSVQRVYPDRGAAPELRAGGEFDLFADGAVDIVLPRQYPFANDPEGNVVEGLDTLKLIVTAEPADFDFLQQEGTRGGAPQGEDRAGAGSPLMALFDSAFNGSRELRRRPAGAEDWTTVTRTFLVRRKKSKKG